MKPGCTHIRQFQVDVVRAHDYDEPVTFECDYTAVDADDAAMMAIMRTKEMMGGGTLVMLSVVDLGAWNGASETFQRTESRPHPPTGTGRGIGRDAHRAESRRAASGPGGSFERCAE